MNAECGLHRRLQHLAVLLRSRQAGVGCVAVVGHRAFDDLVKPRRLHTHLGQTFGQTYTRIHGGDGLCNGLGRFEWVMNFT